VQPASVEADRAPPRITASTLLQTAEKIVVLEGTVRDDSRVVDLSVDGTPVAFESDGSFTIRRGVYVGENTLVLSATDEWGNEAQHRVTVLRERKPQVAPRQPGPAAPNPQDIVPRNLLGSYYALVIGNDTYTHMKSLNTAVRDARAVAAQLRDHYGFEVELLTDASREEMRTAMSRYRNLLSRSDNLLIYYAGHGYNDREAGEAYWLPVDASLSVDTNWISNATITTTLRAIEAKHVMVVADSCYSGTLTRGVIIHQREPGYLLRLAKRRARTALTSGGNEPVMDDDGSGHSVFARAFLRALRENQREMDGTELFGRIRRPVMLGSDQTPQYGDIRRAGHEDGDFIFAPVTAR
jgi:hypothetical protein